MFEDMLAVEMAKLQMEQMERLESEIARRHRAGSVRNEGERQLLAGLAAIGSRALLSLGSALVSTGKRLGGSAPPTRSSFGLRPKLHPPSNIEL